MEMGTPHTVCDMHSHRRKTPFVPERQHSTHEKRSETPCIDRKTLKYHNWVIMLSILIFALIKGGDERAVGWLYRR